MPMPPYPVICYARGCPREALYKIAARWSDGITCELKTYDLACAECLESLYSQACVKRDQCCVTPGESLEVPAIFVLSRGARDCMLQRCEDLENRLRGKRSIPID